MPIRTIHVGCTHFAHGRLQAQINSNGLEPVACVDINLEAAREGVASLKGNVPEYLSERIYTTILVRPLDFPRRRGRLTPRCRTPVTLPNRNVR